MYKILAMAAISVISTLTTTSATHVITTSDAGHTVPVANPSYLIRASANNARLAAVKSAEIPQTTQYLVRAGDTLSKISKKIYSTTEAWPLIWQANRHRVRNPDFLRAGIRLAIPARRQVPAHLMDAALAAAGGTGSGPAPLGPGSPAAASSSAARYAGSGALERCIIANESGGNADIWNASGHWGLYQFAAGTWAGYGGNTKRTGMFGSASAAQQHLVYENVVAAGPQAIYDAWQSDGCPQQYGLDSVSAAPIVLTAAHHRHRDHARWLRWIMHKALDWARTQRGKAYCYGGTGPSCYDCSGLVMTAFRRMGFGLPRTAADMQDSGRLRQVSRPRIGDIVLYGWPAFHAAIYNGHGRIFDALNSGTPVGSQPDTWPGTPIFYQLV